jgi:hypothetical protein
MKKLATLFSFITILGLLLSACGGGAAPATSAPKAVNYAQTGSVKAALSGPDHQQVPTNGGFRKPLGDASYIIMELFICALPWLINPGGFILKQAGRKTK